MRYLVLFTFITVIAITFHQKAYTIMVVFASVLVVCLAEDIIDQLKQLNRRV